MSPIVRLDSTDVRIILTRIEKQQEQESKLLTSLDSKVDALLQTEIPSLRNEIGMLKIKSGMWGAIAGLIPAVLALVLMYLNHS